LAPCIYDQLEWFSVLWAKVPPSTIPAPGLRVAVVTAFVGESESIEMLASALSALVDVSYPHDTWVLDESNAPAVRQLCVRFGAKQFSRKGLSKYEAANGRFERGTKHGNYNAWLYECGFSSYDIVAAFDLDHEPVTEFLDETLGYFQNPRVGYVQAAQCYYNQGASWIARGAAEETYSFYAIVQAATAKFGYPAVIGCHNVHRVVALKAAGGFAPHNADDLLLTMSYQAAGWRGIYVPRILARGITPVSWQSYLDQQYRWAWSVVDLKLHRAGEVCLTRLARVFSILQGARYLLDPLCIAALLVALVLMLAFAAPFSPVLGAWVALSLTIFVTNCYKQRFYLDPATESGLPWRSLVLRLAKAPYLVAALAGVIRRKPLRYKTTPKDGVSKPAPRAMLPVLAMACCIAGAWAVGVWTRRDVNPAVHLVAAVAIAMLIAVVATAFKKPPPAYDPSLRLRPRPVRVLLSRSELLTGIAISVFAAGVSLHGLRGSVVWTDAARHLMNGVFLFDLTRTGNLLHVIRFGKWYYGHLPVLSLPYHPPVFPTFEALFIALFGLKFATIRIALATTVTVTTYLFYRLVVLSTGSAVVAASAAAVFVCMPVSQYLESDIMLEFPASVLVMIGMLYLFRKSKGFSAREGVMYGLITAIGILTKHTVFMAATPFFFFLLNRRFRALSRVGVWISGFLASAAAVLLFVLARAAGWSGVPQHWQPMSVTASLVHNAKFYATQAPAILLLFAGGVIAIALLMRMGSRSDQFSGLYLYISWSASVLIIALAAPAYDSRYVFFALPACIAMGCEVVYRVLGKWLGSRNTAAMIAVGAAVFCAFQARRTPDWFSGPELVASRVTAAGVSRTIYFGIGNGTYSFGVRSACPDLHCVVFPGTKVLERPDQNWRWWVNTGFDPQRVEQFAHDYGVGAIVFEAEEGHTDWPLPVSQTGSLSRWFEQEIDTSAPSRRGRLLVYKVTGAAAIPRDELEVPMVIFGRTLNFELSK
jgi:cellulose synthase (UDP-forming)